MANAAKRMKEKKARRRAALLKAKSKSSVEDVTTVVDDGVVTNVDVVNATEYSESELNGKLKSELIDIAEELGIDSTGTKAELVEKILEV